MVAAMSQTASPRHSRFAIPKEIRIAGKDNADRVWPWRYAVLFMFLWCALVWAGIGLLIAKLID